MNKENRPPADLLPTEAEDPTGAPGNSNAPVAWEHEFFGQYAQQAEFTAMPSGEEDVECAAYIVDNSKGKGGYVTAQSHIIVAGAPSSEFVVKYSPSITTVAWADFCRLSMNTANAVVPRLGTTVRMPDAAAVNKLLLKLIRKGGNGMISPRMWNFLVSAVTARSGGAPGGPTGPLPEDADWGSIIHDLNSVSLAGSYADDQEVGLWPDDGPLFIDGTAGTGVPPGPRFQSLGWLGVLPCVRWPGGNTNAITYTPAPTNSDYTLYLIASNLAGATGSFAYIGDGYPFSKLIEIGAGAVGASVNDNLFSGSYMAVSDTWNMLNPHIYRFVFNKTFGRWWMFLDGNLLMTHDCNPQFTGTINSYLGLHGSFAITMDLARQVIWNKPHVTPDASSYTVPVNGKTLPERILSTFWGTP